MEQRFLKTREMRRVFSRCALVGFWIMTAIASPGEAPSELLWPGGPPEDNGLSGPEKAGGCIGNISVPTVTLHRPPEDEATGAAVVVMPGGGYGVVCVDSEGTSIAKRLNALGITAVVLKYRLPNQHHEIPARDARRAIRLTRFRAKEWGIDPGRVGVWGFSAGGHLASTVATVFDQGDPDSRDPVARFSSRPDFAILFYPVISMEEGVTHPGSRRNLMGSADLAQRYSSDLQVSTKTPPCFLLHCSDDRTVKVENALRFYRALVDHQVPATCLIFENGGHGPKAFLKNPSWEQAFERWLQKRGCLK